MSDIATIGDVNTARPGLMDFTGKAKWCVPLWLPRFVPFTYLDDTGFRDAWKGVEGTSKEDAQAKYVEKLLEVRLRFDSTLVTWT